jgi:outer membrane protein assembly factor BamA
VPGPSASEQSGIGALLASINSDAEGWTPRVGSVTSGSGLALGGHYRQRLAGGNLYLDTEYLASIKGYQSGLFDLSSRPLLNGRLTIGGGVRYTSLPQEDFFGFGAESSLASHTSYERQGLDARGWVAFRPAAGVEIRSTVGLLETKIFSGEQPGVPAIDEVRWTAGFDAPKQGGRFLHAGVEATIDRRDNPRNPHAGTYLRASLDRYSCFTLGENGVLRLDVDGRGYLPVGGFSGNDSLALRAALSLTNADDRQAAFYLLPRLGGGGTLRGFETSRFVDAQAAFMSAEYRWQLRRKLQIVGFVDAGTVASSISQFSGARLHTAIGTGIRYKGFRFDYAVGREGSRFHVGFGPSF